MKKEDARRRSDRGEGGGTRNGNEKAEKLMEKSQLIKMRCTIGRPFACAASTVHVITTARFQDGPRVRRLDEERRNARAGWPAKPW